MTMIVAFLLFAFQAGDIEKNRVEFANCVAQLTIDHLKKESPKSIYLTDAEYSCVDEKLAYVASIKADEIEFGASESEATEYAEEEAANVVDAFVGAYTDFQETNTVPALE